MHGLRYKMVRFNTRIIVMTLLAFLVISCALWFIGMRDSFSSLALSIEQNLISKGKILVINNAISLIGMVEDNSFLSVTELVSLTVGEDKDLIYGIFMDTRRRPWVAKDRTGRMTSSARNKPLFDSISIWAANVSAPQYRKIDYAGMPVFEFAAPVSSPNGKLGTIRYGISAASMNNALHVSRDRFFLEIIVFILAALIFGGIILFVAVRNTKAKAGDITRPLDELTRAAGVIAKGKYSTPIAIRSDDEIGLLAENFEQMRLQIASYIQNLETMVAERGRELEEAQKQVIEKAHKAGMADIAAGVLHNAGNILNSAMVSLDEGRDILGQSPFEGLFRANALLKEKMETIDDFIRSDPKGKKLLQYYIRIDQHLRETNDALIDNFNRMDEKIKSIVNVINSQQTYAGMGGLTEEISVSEVIEDALGIQSASIERHRITIVRDYHENPPVRLQKTKLLHVLINLIKNAKDAMAETPPEKRKLTLTIRKTNDSVRLVVRDTGSGVSPENSTRIFSYGFTTKKKGHGFGLHSSANYLKEMGASISMKSEGPGTGAAFTVTFPLSAPGQRLDETRFT